MVWSKFDSSVVVLLASEGLLSGTVLTHEYGAWSTGTCAMVALAATAYTCGIASCAQRQRRNTCALPFSPDAALAGVLQPELKPSKWSLSHKHFAAVAVLFLGGVSPHAGAVLLL
ncbi:hypothetical protein COO60DRAFT_1531251, partial [Scenedesmus sp. NREL 46B-D3]